MFYGNFAVGCGNGTDLVGWELYCRLWDWNRMCWMVSVLLAVGLERTVLDRRCALGCGTETDCVGW